MKPIDDRSRAIIERIEKSLKEEGYSKNLITEKLKESIIQHPSFFDYLVDLKLQGKSEPSSQTQWEDIKAYVNHLESIIRDAEKSYRSLDIKFKHLTKSYEELIREQKSKN